MAKLNLSFIHDMLSGVAKRSRYTIGYNTEAVRTAHGVNVFLHGNLIAIIHEGGEGATYTLAEWPTVTTRDRLNTLARSFTPGVSFSQDKRVQYVTHNGERHAIGDADAVRIDYDGLSITRA